VKNLVIQLQNI